MHGFRRLENAMTRSEDIPAILDELCEIYAASAGALRDALAAYVSDGTRPDPAARSNVVFPCII